MYYIKFDLIFMDFTVEFYETKAGKCPVREFMDELKLSDPDDFAAVVAGLAKLQSTNIIGRRYPKRLAMDFSSCGTSASSTPMCCGLQVGGRIVLLHGIRNKGQAIPARPRYYAGTNA